MAEMLPSQWALVTSFMGYLAAFYAITPQRPSPLRLAASREAISIFHCTSMTVLTAICLQKELPAAIAQGWEQKGRVPLVADRDLPIITTKSTFANSLSAIETAYLLQDSLVLLLAAQTKQVFLHKKTSRPGKAPAKALRGLNLRHLGWHHALLGSAFVVLQIYIARGKEKGILIIVAMMLMNASSPFGTLRWFLINFRPDLKRTIKALTVAYLIAFGTFRVGLLYYILRAFGGQMDISALKAFHRLRLPCKLGMSSLGLANTAWFLNASRSFVLRELSFRRTAD
ncbi:hypothetical protein H2200_011399 [Cladophialophora chaetospira]|uniref:TLC domain-containing protein n=1 Tax=Cladophialophora chaetospira TaxID=386627 RepID=A0AA39CD67_9EURO|nr:hypothetical protein H2200_011399 [Cladophialophora chaetospira]